MLLKMGILIVLVLASFIFLGIKMSENIKQQEIKMLFFSLYGMTIFTIFNLVVSVYFFTSLRHKRGPAGPKGKKGEMGDKGTNSACDQESCLRKSLQNIIVDYLETRTASGSPAVPEPISLNGKQRTMICSMTKQLNQTQLEGILDKDKIANIKNALNGITPPDVGADINYMDEINKFKAALVNVAKELGNNTITNANIKHNICN